jgi:hypothetical protein
MAFIQRTNEIDLSATKPQKLDPIYKQTSVYKWRISNPQKYMVLSRKHSLSYYYRNRERILEKLRLRYNEQQQQQTQEKAF